RRTATMGVRFRYWDRLAISTPPTGLGATGRFSHAGAAGSTRAAAGVDGGGGWEGRWRAAEPSQVIKSRSTTATASAIGIGAARRPARRTAGASGAGAFRFAVLRERCSTAYSRP